MTNEEKVDIMLRVTPSSEHRWHLLEMISLLVDPS
jgi:4-diphosphocytidyl-2C-methyl-D-erythritol kinase